MASVKWSARQATETQNYSYLTTNKATSYFHLLNTAEALDADKNFFITADDVIDGLFSEKTYQFNSSLVTTLEIGFYGLVEVLGSQFDVAEIDSVTYETRLGAGTTWTSRADVSALNTYLAGLTATDNVYIRIAATYDAAYTGQADLKIQYINLD